MSADDPAGHTSVGLALAFVGRFLAVLCTTAVGLIFGANVGIDWTNAHPIDGIEGLIALVLNLVVGAVGGTLLGLLVGVIGMVVYRRTRGRAR